MSSQGVRFIAGCLLLATPAAWAQTAGTRADAVVSSPAEPATAPAPASIPATPQTLTDASPVAAPVVLQTAAATLEYTLPAGVCPVITDYLYQQCQQNPADAMCAPAASP